MDTSLHISHTQSISASVTERLTRITSEFYAQQAQSFSATRQAPWQGWQKCLESMPQLLAGEKPSVLVFDTSAEGLYHVVATLTVEEAYPLARIFSDGLPTWILPK